MTRETPVLATVVVALGLTVSIAAFSPSPHTGGDNAGYLALGYSLLERGAYLDLFDPDEPVATKYPPVYPAVLAGAMLAGARTWSAFKALSLVFMTVSLLVAFFWVTARGGARFAFLVAVLLALSDTFLWHSHWILSDPLFLLLTLVSLSSLDRVAEGEAASAWIVVGCLAAILAFFTRAAGLPLVLALGLWLSVERRWKMLAAYAVAFAVPALWWWLRVRVARDAGYVAEFWLVDPYQPGLGTVGVGDLAARIWANVQAYVGRWIPGGLMGLRGTPVAVAGIGMTTLAAVGWWQQATTRLRPAELFAPLYLGLILLWPVVWAGDRFAMPLYPLLLFYAGHALLRGLRAERRWLRRAILAGAFLPFALPAAYTWTLSVRDAAFCRSLVRELGAFACYQRPVHEYVRSAEWSATSLGPGSAVMTRKPRLFFVLSGIKARAYPMTRDPSEFLDQALAGGFTHVVVDYLDNLAAYYLVPVIEGRAGAFCFLVGFGDISQSRTEILGVLPPTEWEGVGEATMDGNDLMVSLRICAGGPVGATGSMDPPFGSPDVPLLRSLDRASPRPPADQGGGSP